jgi:hypothetical protein
MRQVPPPWTDENPFINTLAEMFAELFTVGVSGRFYLNRSHALADRVDNLDGDLLGFIRTRLGSIKTGIQSV